MLGQMSFNGQGGPTDYPEARRQYGLAAAQGHTTAQARLGKMYYDMGERAPLEPDPQP